jgi:hypothetical protein
MDIAGNPDLKPVAEEAQTRMRAWQLTWREKMIFNKIYTLTKGEFGVVDIATNCWLVSKLAGERSLR